MAGDIHYDPAFFERLRALEARSFWFRARNALVAEALAKIFPGARDFLDVGCGTGFILEGLAARRPSLRLTGADVFGEAIAFARDRVPGGMLVRADARRLPFAAAFDAAGAFDVLEHIRDDEAVLVEMRRVLRPGGGLLLTVPQHARLWSAADERAGHVRRYTRRDLERKVRAAGFDIEAVTGFVSLLLPALTAVRLWENRRPRTDTLACLAPPRLLDAAFAAAMAAERGLIRRGIRFPFGGSILLAARRR
ncbi:MAG: class I SAM-dependent methyltransferase [Acidobacteriota bacterium]|nr:class I SAM-dependent methyltransferase [Acidobacteriota bacterium]